MKTFWQDENGAVASAELVLIVTVLILGLIVGLSSIQHAIVAELNDIGDASGQLNQTFWTSGFSSYKDRPESASAYTRGSGMHDERDDCDQDQCDLACDLPVREGPKAL